MALSERLCKELKMTVTISRSTLPGLTQDVLTAFPDSFHPSRASRFSCLVDTVTSLGNVALLGLYHDRVPDLPPRPLRVPRLSGSPGLEMRLHRGKLALSTARELGEENKGRELRAGKASFPEAL